MKKIASFISFFAILLIVTCFPKTSYAVDQLVFEGPTLDTPYAGQTQISGYLAAFGTLPSGEKVPVSKFDGAAWIVINGKTYNGTTAGNQMFDYTVTKIDDEKYAFTFNLPDNIVLKEGDKISTFVIPATVENPSNYPQLSHKFSGEYIVQKKADPLPGEDVLVTYLDENGTEIAPKKPISGMVDDLYDATTAEYKLTIDGYTLDETKLPTNATGTISQVSQIVTYTYKENPIKAHDVTVRYVDEKGNQLADSKTISGSIGEPYDASTDAYKPIIDGYTLDETKLPTNATGKLSALDQIVTYTYQKNRVKAQDLTVRYLDENGKELVASQTVSGLIGTPYDVSTATYKLIIDGYTLDATKLPTNAIGTLTDKKQTVTYYYVANKKSDQPTDINQKNSGKPTTQNTTSLKNNKSFPKTGETATQSILYLGGSLILLTGLAYLRKNKTTKSQ
ncbi:hypothetical protein A5821_002509 [Enterococcus sp. 7F3_DIV0205]|uniref:Gram-positive cocci surface proteins LPxTG domain-containing protein n=1 Tax=Candidatus Enterococcus palustris TaxID=1834189 RepID=A0AAQ3WB49_9ENTE|nr:MucBP domain-containing protein [Enterococcus sp. 7F3_DIV0205]OTN82940.1 hypothetical protein A5821_002863 [Enterococcus sp. 7F3_DIV0205]